MSFMGYLFHLSIASKVVHEMQQALMFRSAGRKALSPCIASLVTFQPPESMGVTQFHLRVSRSVHGHVARVGL